jgi:hypothetical protein
VITRPAFSFFLFSAKSRAESCQHAKSHSPTESNSTRRTRAGILCMPQAHCGQNGTCKLQRNQLRGREPQSHNNVNSSCSALAIPVALVPAEMFQKHHRSGSKRMDRLILHVHGRGGFRLSARNAPFP